MKEKHPHSIFEEPHLRPRAGKVSAEPPLDSVWMEPGRSGIAGKENPYALWLRGQNVSAASSWRWTLGLSLIAGPLAVLSVFLTQAPGMGVLLPVVVGPLIEEIGKVMGPLMVVEKNPARFRYSGQIVWCAAASGLLFAVIENLLYLKVYIPDPSPQLISWRWTVCVALHVGCSLIASLGVVRVQRESLRSLTPPKLEHGFPLLLVAVALHGIYNLLAILIDPIFN